MNANDDGVDVDMTKKLLESDIPEVCGGGGAVKNIDTFELS